MLSKQPSMNFILIARSVLKHTKLNNAFSASKANDSPNSV